jgi:UDP-glucose 4-epimerase
MSKVLVTGGAGFIGSNLVERLLHDGHDVRVLDDYSTGRLENLCFYNHPVGAIDLKSGTITDLGICMNAMKNIEYVFHLAAIPFVQKSIDDPILTNENNIDGTLNVLEAAVKNGVKKVIFASSSAVYGDTDRIPTPEEEPTNPLSPYALHKLTGEGYLKLFYELYGLKSIALRYFNVFGPKQNPGSEYSAVIPIFINSILHRKPPTVFGDGNQTRDFTYVSNIVDANILAMENDSIDFGVMNIASGRSVSLNELLDLLYYIIGESELPVYIAPRPGEVRHSMADITRAEVLLDYTPAMGFREGIMETIKYYK